jgi:hypothetical protein
LKEGLAGGPEKAPWKKIQPRRYFWEAELFGKSGSIPQNKEGKKSAEI